MCNVWNGVSPLLKTQIFSRRIDRNSEDKLSSATMEVLTSDKQTRTIRDGNRHSYSRQILTRKSCDFCGKSMYIVGLRCKQCNLKCHRKCAMTAPPQCLLAVDGHSFTNLRGRRTISHNTQRSDKHEHPQPSCACVQKSRPVLHRQHSVTSPDTVVSPPSAATSPCSCISPSGATTSTPIRGDAPAFNFNMVHCSSMPSSPSGTQSSQTSSSSCGYYSLGSEYNVSTVDSSNGITSCTCGCQRITNRLSQSDRRTRWCGGKARTIDVTSGTNKTSWDSEEMRASLISTWPRDFFSHPQQSNEDVPTSIEDAQRICDWMKIETTTNSSVSDRSVREAVREWSIPFENLKFRKCIRRGTYSTEYRGQWHGDVIIHTRDVQDEEDFLEEVSMLSMIRHENIALFMGACIDVPNFCVVTSIQRGISLYERIHISENRLSLNSRVHIARQIAQGMGYLHAKGIAVGCLNSKNIYLESKVKVCMTGHETVDSPCSSDTHACLPKGHITYLAPELLRRAKVTPPTLTIDSVVTQECDIYAFGTVLYELVSQSWPFRHSSIESVIYQVCSASRQSVSHIKCSTSLKDVIIDCWAHDQVDRPKFSSIIKDLQDNAALVNMNRSRSEPENLNRLGLPGRPW